MEPQDSQSQKPIKKGYSRRPMWQWVLLYVVVAIVVYGLVYLLFFRKTAGSGGYTY